MNEFNEKRAEIVGLIVIGLSGVLSFIFVLLRFCGYIGWSWKWVFGPLWIPWALLLAFCFLLSLFVIAAGLFERFSVISAHLLKAIGKLAGEDKEGK